MGQWGLAATEQKMKSETELACELIRVLDQMPIDLAKNALQHAIGLLASTQTVRADSPLLMAKLEAERAIRSD
jgi:hypothetical protein